MFTFACPPEALFAERRRQFSGWGIPDEVLDAVAGKIIDTWSDGPGGWTTEWSEQARRLAEQERWLDAALTYGAARFPCLATPSRLTTYERQLDLFARATGDTVRREVVRVPYRAGTLEVPVHRYPSPRPTPRASLVLTGGVDTWKVELHRMATAFQQLAEPEVAVFDMPGTGESGVRLAPDADLVYEGVVDAVAHPGLPIGVMGVSFGGMWAAKLALRRRVDFAVDLGGPIGASFPDIPSRVDLPNGMDGIVAHALGLDGLPTPEEVPELLADFSLAAQGLLGPDREPAPLLVLNGMDDVYVPRGDSTVFEQYPQARVTLLADSGHCAAERITEAVGQAIEWIIEQGDTT